MIKRYLNTFKGDSTSQIARRFAFTLFTFIFAFLFSIYFAIAKTFTPPVALFVDLTLGFIMALIVDLTAGIGRKSPLIKDKDGEC